MKKFILGFALVLCLAGAGNSQQQDYEKMKGMAVKYLEESLIDYDSAKIKFGPIETHQAIAHGHPYLCIKINAKNRLGGYTGYQMSIIVFNNGAIDKMQTTVMNEQAFRIARAQMGVCNSGTFE